MVDHLSTLGHDVHGAARRIQPSSRSHIVDLTELGGVEGLLTRLEPDVVLKIAGSAESDPTQLAESHVVTTVNLMVAAGRLRTPPVILVAGSAAEYGSPDGDSLVREDAALRPVSGYGWVKVAETTTARSLADALSLDLTVVRPFNIVSPDLPPSSALGNFRRQLNEGTGDTRVVRCGRVDVIRDYVTASFVGEAIAELVSDPPGGTVNVCSGVGIRLVDLMEAAAQQCGVDMKAVIDPDLAAIPAPAKIVGDPKRLNSLIAARPVTDTVSLALVLMG